MIAVAPRGGGWSFTADDFPGMAREVDSGNDFPGPFRFPP